MPVLATRGEYIGSESSLYRFLHEEGMQHLRGPARLPVSRPHEFTADGPMQLASWDITYLRSSRVKGEFFFLYLVEDVWSRKIIGWEVHDSESDEFAARIRHRYEIPTSTACTNSTNEQRMRPTTWDRCTCQGFAALISKLLGGVVRTSPIP